MRGLFRRWFRILHQKIRAVHITWLMADFLKVMLFVSTHTPLKVRFPIANLVGLSRLEPIDFDKIIKIFLAHSHQPEILNFSKFFDGIFWKNWFSGEKDSRINFVLHEIIKLMFGASQRYQLLNNKVTLRVCKYSAVPF